MQVQDIRTTPIVRTVFVVGIGLLIGIGAVLALEFPVDPGSPVGSNLVKSAEGQESIHASFDIQFLESRKIELEPVSITDPASPHAPFEFQIIAWSSAYAAHSTVSPAPAHATFEMQLLASKSNSEVDAMFGVSPVHATFKIQQLQAIGGSPQR